MQRILSGRCWENAWSAGESKRHALAFFAPTGLSRRRSCALQRPGRYCPRCFAIHPITAQLCHTDGLALEDCCGVLNDKFILRAPIGKGGMGTVYEAIQLPMGRRVAVKLLHPELSDRPDVVARFRLEAQAAASVDHPNAVIIHDSGVAEGGELYIAMEFLEGEGLRERLLREGPLAPAHALRLWLPAVEAMAAAHEAGVLHRDLKPDNIFIARKHTWQGPEERVKVLDFGIAKICQGQKEKITHAGTVLGTVLYLSPERLHGGEADSRSDVYALGLILVELLTGQLPWDRAGDDTWRFVLRRLRQAPLPLSALRPGLPFSDRLQRLLDAALSPARDERPADAGELLRWFYRVAEAAPPGPVLSAGTPASDPQVEYAPTLVDQPSTLLELQGAVPQPMPAPVLAVIPSLAEGPQGDSRVTGPPPRGWPFGLCRAGAALLACCLGCFLPLVSPWRLWPYHMAAARGAAPGALCLAAGATGMGAPSCEPDSDALSCGPAVTTSGRDPLRVRFVARLPELSVVCGTGRAGRALRPVCSGGRCQVSATLRPDQRCDVSSPGYAPRRYFYEDLRATGLARGQHALRVRVDLRPAG